ncbi:MULTISPECIES: SCP2 sterol-binding domain-containing protein [Actinosynnema]|uniref:SCP2 sterol-binding domain-containing protein n=1 Tax=Actinosynnema TaxID=40566 RepID=UPI0020A54258|nr:SCP2 sterol-binding domain-containing protein [Actinosynnema pretiosum]MCP2093628.1 SCP-2 sterol transfer family protein [Actinosynnema pretiosum]
MSIDLTAEAVAGLRPAELISALEGASPDDPALRSADVNAIAEGVDPRKLTEGEFADLLAALGALADAGAPLDLAAMGATNFARLVSRASKGQLDEAFARPAVRGRVLDEVFRRMERHFRPERAGATRAVVHFALTGPEEDHYQVVVEDERCSIAKGFDREPRAVVTAAPTDFVKLATGNASAPVLFMTGKLKVRGDLGLAAGFMGLFDIPRG